MSDRPGADRPSPQDATRALEHMRKQQDEALTGRREPLALKTVLAGGLAAFCASYDFVDDTSIPITVYAVVLVAYVLLARSRRGSALLGYDTTGPRVRSMPTDYVLTILACVFGLITFGDYAVTPVMSFLRGHHVAYYHTLVGIVAAVLVFPLAWLGRRMQIRLLGHIRDNNEGV
jgi:hypothetical protein